MRGEWCRKPRTAGKPGNMLEMQEIALKGGVEQDRDLSHLAEPVPRVVTQDGPLCDESSAQFSFIGTSGC